MARCVWVDDCLIWQGGLRHGYGEIRDGKKVRETHRVAYEHTHGPIPKGLIIDHVLARGCTSTACCNEAHLEAVTHRTNILRGNAPAAQQARQTHCKRGHPLIESNIYRRPSNPRIRACRMCITGRWSREHTERKMRELRS